MVNSGKFKDNPFLKTWITSHFPTRLKINYLIKIKLFMEYFSRYFSHPEFTYTHQTLITLI